MLRLLSSNSEVKQLVNIQTVDIKIVLLSTKGNRNYLNAWTHSISLSVVLIIEPRRFLLLSHDCRNRNTSQLTFFTLYGMSFDCRQFHYYSLV